MTLRVVSDGSDGTGPLDAEARALLERILALKPLALVIVYETPVMCDFDCLPNLEILQNGVAETVMRILALRREG